MSRAERYSIHTGCIWKRGRQVLNGTRARQNDYTRTGHRQWQNESICHHIPGIYVIQLRWIFSVDSVEMFCPQGSQEI